MPRKRRETDKYSFVRNGISISRLKQEAKTFKKSEGIKLRDAQNHTARQQGFADWSQMSAVKLQPIDENDEIVGFWQRLDKSEHEIYIDHLYEEIDAWPNDPIAPMIFIKIIMEMDEGEELYVSSLHFKNDEGSPNESRIIRQVQADGIEAMCDFLEGGMTAGKIMNALGPIGVFDFDPREIIRSEIA
ncbi:hypothetical protein [Sulfitobacter sp. D7]|uniref:hypothetical protein n=1 Tax=Sulfitobacter sp. D7 TaxID=1968541 RepID=UPI0013C4EE7F|nr:hypothetical protein [Sulfitobacter sp. D7]